MNLTSAILVTDRQFGFAHKRFATPFIPLGDSKSHLQSIDVTFAYRGHEILDIDYDLNCTPPRFFSTDN